jgi:hypothetical protein
MPCACLAQNLPRAAGDAAALKDALSMRSLNIDVDRGVGHRGSGDRKEAGNGDQGGAPGRARQARDERETSAIVRDKGLRAVIVTVVGGVLELRAKGLRSSETMDIGWCCATAVKRRVQRDRALRDRARCRRQVGARRARST